MGKFFFNEGGLARETVFRLWLGSGFRSGQSRRWLCRFGWGPVFSFYWGHFQRLHWLLISVVLDIRVLSIEYGAINWCQLSLYKVKLYSRQFLGWHCMALVVVWKFETFETHFGGELVMVQIPDQFGVYFFDFGHSPPNRSPVKVRFRNLCSPWLPNVSDQVIVTCVVIEYSWRCENACFK